VPSSTATGGPADQFRGPARTADGIRLRSTARLLALTIGAADPGAVAVRLVMKLAALADAVSELRNAQQHAAQAAAARRAAEQLHADLVGVRSRATLPAWLARSGRTRPANAADLLCKESLLPLRLAMQAPVSPGSSPTVSYPTHGHQPPKRAGPRP
jgi:hypothetical protein